MLANDLITFALHVSMEGGKGRLVTVEKKEGYAVVRLNRPEVRNALSFRLVSELSNALSSLDSDGEASAIVLAGGGSAFSAGADVREMAGRSTASFIQSDDFTVWDRISSIRKPLIAAVHGYAFGGGCELAMACDIIIAEEGSRFGQPEIKLGIMPGAGGTQRLTLALGKHRAMLHILTGEPISAEDAERLGLVSALVPKGKALEEASRIAGLISALPPAAVLSAKRAVQRAAEGGIRDGLLFERSLFYSLFSTLDQKEGMDAFLAKRKPVFRGE